MKIGIIGNEEQRKELELKTAGCEASLYFIETIGHLTQWPEMDAYFDLEFRFDTERVDLLKQLLPATVVINALAPTLEFIGQPFIRINGWPGFLNRKIWEVVSLNDTSAKKAAAVFESMHCECKWIPDIPGMISARVIAGIINEAYYALQEKVSTRESIDLAMKLGTNYPFGPFEWARKIGIGQIYEVLQAMRDMDDRYTIAEALVSEVLELGSQVAAQ
jgi:3-hydroxybutyryl-CoA dehydrogenase